MDDPQHSFSPYKAEQIEESEAFTRLERFLGSMKQRRSCRYFSDRHVPKEVLENIVKVAVTAPSGANKQPWFFALVTDPIIKKQIREAAEKEEYENYHGRMSEEWLEDLKQFGTDWNKPFLETAPGLIVVFKKAYDMVDEERKKNYYVNESVGIACGFLLASIQQAGLVSLTHTPSPMNFLAEVLGRPDNERAFLLVPVGYPAEDAVVPDIEKKELNKVFKSY